ncbi:MAG: NDMA-dependent alcohol dehydrogenase [Actinobacteria bacterium]|nr:NDMA-dependent alcohol dehydrogenase [Actinomycetota bacterium]MSY12953.1 NDMA-dependent alcohol dehydrogenase [Actinomycetota bacterium]MSZ05187.1 NDMA-dependent alcohol dehydrogenase [Actinomycetota bacterium]MTB07732.1 NDMA-dependent alcohol dehydrogenase [Actinomycetota bacterium]
MMKSKAAICHGAGTDWKVEEIDIDPPKVGEVLVQWKYAGMCHSDEHFLTGDLQLTADQLAAIGQDSFYPVLGGHEGAGIVLEVGPGVTTVQLGDHVSASFVPSCGRCKFCSTGRQNLCDNGAGTLTKGMITDGTSRHNLAGQPIAVMAGLGTFSQYAVVSENSLIKVDKDLPLNVVALVSCGVATGWGSATKRADVQPGDTVVVIGIGGIGINAVQGAKMAGAKHVIAIDPIEFKREKAMEFGATHTYASMAEAMAPVTDLTWGQMAEKVIMTPGIMYGDLVEGANQLCQKGGTIVITAVAPVQQEEVSLNLFNFAMSNKELKGTIFGSLNPRADIPKLLGLYRDGLLKLDELITREYSLDEINLGYQHMRDGVNIRGVIKY